MLTWEIVNQCSFGLASAQARSNWRQRGNVPHRHRFMIRARAAEIGIRFDYEDFDKLKPLKFKRRKPKRRNGKA